MQTTQASPISLSENTFTKFQEFIHSNFGIFLAEHKREMLGSRLRGIVARNDCSTFEAYFDRCLVNASGAHLEELMNAVSTNHTYFNRESFHYDELKRRLPKLAERAEKRQRRKEIRVWCAAASFGHEPYTLSMILADHFGSSYKSWDAGILATDISDNALEKARRGVYADEEVMALPAAHRDRHLKRLPGGEWEICQARKTEVTFRRFNLMNELPFRKPFDVVFLRNVMIYFDSETQNELVARIARHLYPGGLLFVGLAESVSRSSPDFVPVANGVYERKP
ncbi:MAG: chemotaxis protein methyltransferase CheR [Polyangiales bacterium]|jgi:chemotaxis protein methyltransferase CheR